LGNFKVIYPSFIIVKVLLPDGTSLNRKYPLWSVVVVLVDPLILISAPSSGVELWEVSRCTSPSKEPLLGLKVLQPLRKRVKIIKNKKDKNRFDNSVGIGFGEFILDPFVIWFA